MEIKDYLLGKLNCECGKDHVCPIESVVIGENACDSLPSLIEKYQNILLVADTNTDAVLTNCGLGISLFAGFKTVGVRVAGP